ncbi:MAG: AmmeMemoRadiSam system protein A [Alphaproteobacteria bacterium]
MSSTEPERLLARHGELLLEIAAASIEAGLKRGCSLAVNPERYPAELRAHHASFVTLKKAERLRGCVGSPEACRALVTDVAENAFRSGFRDTRFEPLNAAELADLEISVSVLSRPEPFGAGTQDELLESLRPGIDGLILEEGDRRALFLPQVWGQVTNPREFLDALKEKAGLKRDHWSPELGVKRFTSASLTRRP